MGAANLDKMVEKNRDLLECVGGEILKMCWSREEERNGELSTARAMARPAGGRFKAGEPLVPVLATNRY